jgi:hypothetical protein
MFALGGYLGGEWEYLSTEISVMFEAWCFGLQHIKTWLQRYDNRFQAILTAVCLSMLQGSVDNEVYCSDNIILQGHISLTWRKGTGRPPATVSSCASTVMCLVTARVVMAPCSSDHHWNQRLETDSNECIKKNIFRVGAYESWK